MPREASPHLHPAQGLGWLRDEGVTLERQPLQGLLRDAAPSSGLPDVALFPFLHLFSALPFPPVKADWEARLSWVAANTLQKAGAWQAHSVASVGAAG